MIKPKSKVRALVKQPNDIIFISHAAYKYKFKISLEGTLSIYEVCGFKEELIAAFVEGEWLSAIVGDKYATPY